MKHARRNPHAPVAGFSLIEILVAMAVFLVIALILLQMSESTMRVTNQSERRIEVDSDAWQALSRISADVSRAIIRSDLPWRIEKSPGNDSIAYFAQADAYTPGRGISMVGFRVKDYVLERGVQATSWNSADATALPFTSPDLAGVPANFLEIDDANFETLNKNIFRLEIAFLTADGRIVRDGAFAGSNLNGDLINFAASPRDQPEGTCAAIIIAVAAVDARARATMTDADFAQLMTALPEANDSEDLLSRWQDFLDDTSLSPQVRESVRIYQRYIPISR